jgi:hypothetical protein
VFTETYLFLTGAKGGSGGKGSLQGGDGGNGAEIEVNLTAERSYKFGNIIGSVFHGLYTFHSFKTLLQRWQWWPGWRQ